MTSLALDCGMTDGLHQKDHTRPPNRPAQQMLMACCDNVCPVGRPFLHLKDYIIKNLRLLFANVPEVTNDDFGSLKSWIREAIHEKYWTQLVNCLTNQHAPLPPRPDDWPWPRQSPRNHGAPPRAQQPFPPTPPCAQRSGCTEQEHSNSNQQHRVPSNSPPPVDNALTLLSNHRNQTPRTNVITYLNRLGEACTTP